MKNNIKLYLFITLAVLQLLIPAQMILSHELTLLYGQEYKFHVEPADPYDPFRGKYLYINAENTEFTVNDAQNYHPDQVIYVLIENDANGFTKFSGISLTRPESGAYIKSKITYITDDKNSNSKKTLHFSVPFDRYYMPENDAPAAEKLYNEKTSGNSIKDVYVVVKIHKGTAVLDKLYIGNKTIEEYLKQ
ncbi:GDYXXLXY domain-containing protein [Acetivibrio cellulolyticus]|uniref:GDYXXLXY domain-containing protein n=1 Tax=Acetivibrio cellulolyticus TaxID=35830 RepID=UPI0001E2E719|nr:GDYXXLXY domain-containing protein [Acetivibrio cellulolyticus]